MFAVAVRQGCSALRRSGVVAAVQVQAAPAVACGASVCNSPWSTTARRFAGKKAGRRRAMKQRGGAAKSRFKMRPRAEDPNISKLLKQFYLKVHPDLFGQFPELRAANEEAMRTLNGLLEEMKSGESPFPPRRTQRITFYARMPAGDDASPEPAFMRVPLDIKTTGADCRHLMAESFHKLFKAVGLPDTFHWGPEYWDKQLEAPTYISSKEYNQQQQARAEYERQGRKQS